MLRKTLTTLFVGMLAALNTTPSSALELREIGAVNVLADARLATPLTEIATRFAQENSITVSGAFGDTAKQKKRIEDGEAADLFITPDPSLVQQLKEKGMVDIHTIGRIASHRDAHYTAAVVAGENMPAARTFLQYLHSDEAREIFRKNGMTAP